MRALLVHVRPHRRTLVLAAVLGLLGAAAGLAQPLAAREVIEALAADDPLTRALVILSALVVAAAIVTAVHFWLLERTAQRIVLRARRGLTGRILRLRMGELDRLAPGIAHRLSTVVAADRILLIEAGRVRAQGTHVELVETDELYRELAATQLTA
jgi:ABC-type multidrug transport system fused ATPase/permease subunit